MYGHMNAAAAPAAYPQYFQRSRGTRLWDVDGNEYLDLMCGWGPMLLGYGDPVVEAAADAQRREGDLFSGTSPRMVELAELFVDTVEGADWAMFAKNGTDATTMAVTIARAATGRKKLLKARKAYHGAAPWCTPGPSGLTPEDRANTIQYDYNDLASVALAAERAGGNDEVAAIIVSPVRQDSYADQEMADPEFACGLRELCNRLGAVLILDDVRCGLRLDLAGSWAPLGVVPDLSAWSKAIANGYPLAALTGTDALRAAASSVYVTGSFWFTATAMAAGTATIEQMKKRDGIETMKRIGGLLVDGLTAQAASHGLGVTVTGPPSMPFLRFHDDTDFDIAFHFAAAAVERGLLLHPWHNWFVSVAHTEADIYQAMAVTDEAFAAVARRDPIADAAVASVADPRAMLHATGPRGVQPKNWLTPGV